MSNIIIWSLSVLLLSILLLCNYVLLHLVYKDINSLRNLMIDSFEHYLGDESSRGD